MDHEEGKQALRAFFKKYRWAAAVVLSGIILMSLPQGAEKASEHPQTVLTQPGLAQQLETLLTNLQGAGTVRVLLTERTGEQIHYQTDQDGPREDRHLKTVVITGSDRAQTGLVLRTDPPVWQGAVVLCQGADSAAVRRAVVDAVATATGLTSDKITVLKMK
jgi:stage III sporulation protein AG